MEQAAPQSSEMTLPVDIPCQKLLVWLIDRQQIAEDWQRKVRAVRQKIDAALGEMPDVDEVVTLLSGQYIDYFTCAKVLETLKGDSKTGTKSWFGQHTDKHTINWQSILDDYAQDNVFLGECAHQLMQNAMFELPNMKKKMGKLKTTVPELRRKVGECKHMSKQYQDTFAKACDELGIAGTDVEAELKALSSRLPEVFNDAESLLQANDVGVAATFYKEMVQFVHKCDTSHMLPALKQAQEHGVAATSATEQADGAVAEIDWDIGTDADTGADIDWGVGGGEPAAAEIDWGISGGDDTGQEDEAGEIDWGGGGDGGDGAAEIDWGEGGAVQIEVEAAGADNAEGPLDLLVTSQRNALVNDLMEQYRDPYTVQLAAFLTVRKQEMSGKEAFGLLSKAPSLVANMDQDQLGRLEDSVAACLHKLNGAETHKLVMLHASEKYLARVVQTTTAKRKGSDLMLKRAKELETQIEEINTAAKEEQPKFDEVVARTNFLKSKIESVLSDAMGGRPVHIVGEINTLLQSNSSSR